MRCRCGGFAGGGGVVEGCGVAVAGHCVGGVGGVDLDGCGWRVGERADAADGGGGLDACEAFSWGIGGGGGLRLGCSCCGCLWWCKSASGGVEGFGDGFGAGDEFVVNGFVGLEPAFGVPPEASSDEVEEGFVFAFQGLLERFRAGTSTFAL